MRRAAFPLSIACLGVLMFAAWMHPAVLWPGNVGWLLTGDDRGQSAIGLAAYLRAGGPWPGLHEPLLAAPEGMTLLFTDSIPLLGLVLKPFAPLLPAGAQYIGLWYLACCLLQAGFAAALVRRHAPDVASAIAGAALLAAMPALFNRFGHASLCAQWLLLWALWIFVDDRRARLPGWWAAVLCGAALVHNYLLLMVAAIWGAAMLQALVREPGRMRTLAAAAMALAPVLVVVAMHGVFGQHFMSSRSYGSWPVALDAWWNPQNPGFTALLPSTPDRHGIGFEGFQYLGAGLLALVIIAAVQGARGGVPPVTKAELARLAWLLPPFAALAILAIGPEPLWRGQPLFSVNLPIGLINLLDPVRAAGRLVWPLTYTLVYAVLLVTFMNGRSALLLSAAVALQIVDLTPMLAAVRETSVGAEDRTTYKRTLDPRWTTLTARASAIEFQPAEPYRDLQLMEEVASRAVAACRPTRYFYASRETATVRARLAADRRLFAAGTLDPTRLYVLLGRAPVPAAVASRVRVMDGVRLIPPSRPAPPPACSSSPPAAP